MDQLYSFRECYFETHSVEHAGRKQQDVREEMEKTLQQMEEAAGMSPKRTHNLLFFIEMRLNFSLSVDSLVSCLWLLQVSTTDYFF